MVRLWTVAVRPVAPSAGSVVCGFSVVLGRAPGPAVVRRRSPGTRSWALVQPAPWTQKRWVGVVVTVPPSSVDTLQVTAPSCTGASRTSRTSSAPVWGLWARTRSPTSTRAMGLVDPSAMTTGVSAVKHAHPVSPCMWLVILAVAPPVRPPPTAPPPTDEARPPTVWGPGPAR